MSFRDATRPQDLGPERLNPVQGAPILDASVEAEGRATDLCTGHASRDAVRARILVWLAEGSREVTWALCSLPRERWAIVPPVGLGSWSALRHVRHLALREMHQLLPTLRRAQGESASILADHELAQADAAWDTATADGAAEDLVRGFGDTRFELLQRLETAPDALWEQPLPDSAHPVHLDWLLLSARQHELQHVAALWKIALNWDRV